MIMVALLSITMLLAACSSGTATTPAAGEGTGASSNNSSMAVSSDTGSQTNKDNETRTVSTVKGDVVVPANPKRVVVLYLQETSLRLELSQLLHLKYSTGLPTRVSLKV